MAAPCTSVCKQKIFGKAYTYCCYAFIKQQYSGSTKSSILAQPYNKENKENNLLFDFDAQSLKDRGYLRTQKPYEPPSDVEERLKELCKDYFSSTHSSCSFENVESKFSLLVECSKEFNHAVPNSELHRIKTFGDLLKFYTTPISTTVPLDMMKNINLPKNIHIQYGYIRFHPETDSKFGGVTAFPYDSTIVTGLKYKKKYPGFKAKPFPEPE